MAVPAFATAGAGAVATGSSLSVPYPASISAGDLLILQIMQYSSMTADPTNPSGFGAPIHTDTANGSTQFIYSKTADGTETGNLAVTVTSDATGHYGRMYRFTGDAGGTWATEGAATGNGTDSTIEMPSITTTAADRLAVAFIALRDDNAIGSATGESGGNWTEATAEYTSSTGNDACLQLQTADMASAGTISGGSASQGFSDGWIVRGFAIYKDAGGSAGQPYRKRTGGVPFMAVNRGVW